MGFTSPEEPLPAFYVSKLWSSYDQKTKDGCKRLFDYVLQNNVKDCVYVFRDDTKKSLKNSCSKNSLLQKATSVLHRSNTGHGFVSIGWDTMSLSNFVFAIIHAAVQTRKTISDKNTEEKISEDDYVKKIRQLLPQKSNHFSLEKDNWMNTNNDSQIAVIRIGDCIHFMMFTYNATIKQCYVYNMKLYIDTNNFQTLEIQEVTESHTKPLDWWMNIYNQTIQIANDSALASEQQGGKLAGSRKAASRDSSVGSGSRRSKNTPVNAGAAQDQRDHQHDPQNGHQHGLHAGAGAATPEVPAPPARQTSRSHGKTPDGRPNAIHAPPASIAAVPSSHHGGTQRSASANRHAGQPPNPPQDPQIIDRGDQPASVRSASVQHTQRIDGRSSRHPAALDPQARPRTRMRSKSSAGRAHHAARNDPSLIPVPISNPSQNLYEWTGVDKDTYSLWTAMTLAVLTKPEGDEKTRLMSKLLPIVARELFGLDCESVHSVKTYAYVGEGHHASADTQDGQVFIMYKNGKYVDFFYQGSEKPDELNAKLCTGDIESKKKDYFSLVVTMPSKPQLRDDDLWIFDPDPNLPVGKVVDGNLSDDGSEYVL